jgi:predicted dehydrogenase
VVKKKVKTKSVAGSVRLGVIGLGNMGCVHARSVRDGRVEGCELAAVCDMVAPAAGEYGDAAVFGDFREMVASGLVDAVVIATPHFSHVEIGREALRAGMHVLVEKPIAVHKADCERLLAAHRGGGQVFAAMFNQRTDPYYRKVRDLVRGGELGAVRRVNWIITDWFRTEAYYASGGWRATWAGEGGGVLLNQCPHNLDLYQWIFGMPDRVRGFCALGRYHDIEVEDDVTAYFEYADGKTAVFVTSTGEAPGTNRLEVVGERGRLVLEDGRLKYLRNEVPTSEFSRTTGDMFGRPAVWDVTIPLPPERGSQHLGILKNFVAAVREGEPLIAPAGEGIYSVELANAILESSFSGKTIDLPLSGAAYERRLKKLMAASRPRKKVVKKKAFDFEKSFR